MAKITVLQIAMCLLALYLRCDRACGYTWKECTWRHEDPKDEGIIWEVLNPLEHQTISNMSDNNETFASFYSALYVFSHSTENKPDFQKSIDEIKGWVNEQRTKGDEEAINKVGGALKTTVNALHEFKSGDPYDLTCGTLDIISSVAVVAGGPHGVAFSALCSIAGAIVSANKPAKPSVVEQLAKVVHSALNDFHNKLQGAQLSGLKGRVQRQQNQLREMKQKQELDDPNVWNDYDQFLGELLLRVASSLPFKYEKNLEKDADMADFVRAVATYCNAYTCFMALLTAAKGKFQEFDKSSDEVRTIDQFINHQKMIVKETLAFLSDKKYLKFNGRLPSERGKLTKILLLTRNPKAKQLVESVRGSLGLTKMADSDEVEEAVEKVSRQSVKSKLHAIPETIFSRATAAIFINETDFPMRIVSGTVGWPTGNLEFRKDVKPHSYHDLDIWSVTGTFSTGGYIKIVYGGELSSDPATDDPNEGDVGVIEFALSCPYAGSVKINIEDKSDTGRTQGKDAYDNMTKNEEKRLYWKRGKVHYMARADIIRIHQLPDIKRNLIPLPYVSRGEGTWFFTVQDFDPDQDLIEKEK
ncbi:hypothetical protein OS493_029755 [Desmophyllum pertusum]|uniref:Uncharacterized protein n=1 Tax=Desmophyllum pertusum TaxID=174260 RepID=A0A9X0CPM4_9CNID|nr:hypothetical protein OS493_029755 [Desmophyllum pertusum]